MWSISDVLIGNYGIFPIEISNQWYFQLFIFSGQARKTIGFFFLFGLEIAQNRPWWGSWWVSVADRKYNECLLLKSDISYQSHLLLINSAILSVNFFMFTFKTIFLLFFMLFIKENILLMKNQRDLVRRYVLVILSRFEKTLQTTKSKLTNEKTNYNEL